MDEKKIWRLDHCIFRSIFLFFYFILYSFHGFIYDSFFFSIFSYSSLFIIIFCFLIFLSLLLIRLVCYTLGLFLLSVLTTVIVHNLYTDLLVAHRRRSTSEEWKKWKGKNAHERENERKKERNRGKGGKGTDRYTYDIHACSSQIRLADRSGFVGGASDN